LQVFDHRRVVDIDGGCGICRVLRLVITELKVQILGFDGLEDAVLGDLTIAIQPAAQLVVLDDDRLGSEAGLKLDIVKRLQVARIGERNKQAIAAQRDRQYTMLGQQFRIDRAFRDDARIKRIKIEQRQAKGHGSEGCDLIGTETSGA